MVSDRNDNFGRNVQRTFQKKIVRSVNRSGETIFNRSEHVFSGPFVDGDKEGLEGWARHELNVFTEQLDGCLLAEGAALSLKSYPCAGSWLTHKIGNQSSFSPRSMAQASILRDWRIMQLKSSTIACSSSGP